MKISVGIFCKLRIANCGLRIGRTTADGQFIPIFRDFQSAIRNSQPAICRSAIGLLVFLLAAFVSGCGKIADPLPPIPRAPLVVDELRIEQKGTELILSFPFTRPPRSARLQRIDIYRLAEPVTAPMGISQEAFSARASVIASIPETQVPLNSSVITYPDPLDIKSITRDIRYRYAVRLINKEGTETDYSNFAMIQPVFNLALPPGDFQTKQRETEIELTWAPPAANENGTQPANVGGYNLYRKAGDSFVKLNAEPLAEPRFIDRNFQFGGEYEYVVRALSFPPNNGSLLSAIESNPSAMLRYTAKDTFPPTAPTSLTIASINGLVSLFWPLNSEPDVEGYNIYRSENEKDWVRLNTQLHKTASFRDDRVQVGKLYFYQITAVDTYGNESPRSGTVSETVAP